MATLSATDLQNLQAGIAGSQDTIEGAYAATTDPEQRQQLQARDDQLAAQCVALEKTLFHLQTVEASDEAKAAFDAAQGFTQQLKALASSLERVSDIISAADKLLGALAQVVTKLA